MFYTARNLYRGYALLGMLCENGTPLIVVPALLKLSFGAAAGVFFVRRICFQFCQWPA